MRAEPAMNCRCSSGQRASGRCAEFTDANTLLRPRSVNDAAPGCRPMRGKNANSARPGMSSVRCQLHALAGRVRP
jgi:hypothetical protein